MAINYLNLFEDIGEFVQRVNNYVGYYSDLDTDESEIEAELTGNGREDILSGTPEMFVAFKGMIVSWITQLITKITQRITHRVTILEELHIGDNTSIDQVLYDMIRDMNDNTRSVQKNTVTLGSVTDDKDNTNAGTVLIGKILDGVTDPNTNMISNPEYLGLDSELAITDSMAITCLVDSNNGGATEGNESFQWVGIVKPTAKFNWETPGSGNGPTLNPLNSFTIITNLDFEDFTTNAPDDWDIDTGTAGTHIDDDTVTPYHGDKALKLTGDSALGTIQISQTVDTSLLAAAKRYCFAAWIKGTAAMLAGTLTIQFEGTGYTAGATEKISLAFGTLAAMTSYTLKYFFVNMPEEFPDDFEIVIKVSGTPTTAKPVYIDRACFGPVDYFNGIHASVICGSEKFVRGDRFTFTTTNDEAGVFQSFFRDAYGVQLPSSGAPTIADSLAT